MTDTPNALRAETWAVMYGDDSEVTGPFTELDAQRIATEWNVSPLTVGDFPRARVTHLVELREGEWIVSEKELESWIKVAVSLETTGGLPFKREAGGGEVAKATAAEYLSTAQRADGGKGDAVLLNTAREGNAEPEVTSAATVPPNALGQEWVTKVTSTDGPYVIGAHITPPPNAALQGELLKEIDKAVKAWHGDGCLENVRHATETVSSLTSLLTRCRAALVALGQEREALLATNEVLSEENVSLAERCVEGHAAHNASFGALRECAVLLGMEDLDDYSAVPAAIRALTLRAQDTGAVGKSESEKDTERLDWLEKSSWLTNAGGQYVGAPVRAAIDAARSAVPSAPVPADDEGEP